MQYLCAFSSLNSKDNCIHMPFLRHFALSSALALLLYAYGVVGFAVFRNKFPIVSSLNAKPITPNRGETLDQYRKVSYY